MEGELSGEKNQEALGLGPDKLSVAQLSLIF